MNIDEQAAADAIMSASNNLDAAIKKYNPIAVVGLMSGGDDSLPACYIASLHENFSGILHVNTGIGIEATRTHVRKLCSDRGWKLWEYKAEENVNAKGEPDPQIYEEIVMKYGFPGPSMHGMMYSMLKERQLRRFERDMGANGRAKEKKRIMYISGARIKESQRRMGNAKLITVEPRRVWLNIILQWDKAMCAAARDHANLPQNPVANQLGMSGECLCGAFAKPGELDRVRACDPQTANRIQALEARARTAGYNWGWDESPRKNTINRDQFELLSTPSIDQQLCRNCIFGDEVTRS